MIHLLDLRHKLCQMSPERSGIVVVENVEVDAMPTARKEGGAITVSVPQYDGSARSGRKARSATLNSLVQILPHDPQHQGSRTNRLQVPPGHLQHECRRTGDDGNDASTPLDGPLDGPSCRTLLLLLLPQTLDMRHLRTSTTLQREERHEFRLMRERSIDEEVGREGEGSGIGREEARGSVQPSRGGEAD